MYVFRWLAMLLLSSVLDAATLAPLPSISPTLPSILPFPSHSSSLSSPLDISSKQQCTLVITPSELVVRFGDPLFANCSIGMMEVTAIGWDIDLERLQRLPQTRFQVLDFERLTKWSLKPMCFVIVDHGGNCSSVLHLTVYKPPDNVSISFVNHTGPLLEGHQYTLQCRVQDVAPVQNLTVTFYRGDAMLVLVQSSSNSVATPVTETFIVSINSSREDDGVQYWCEAKLNLGPQGPAPLPVMRSQKLKAVVYYGPHSLCPKELHLREGMALSWEVRGNPQPLLTWLRDGKVVAQPNQSGEQAGNYTVSAKGAFGWLNCTMKVDFLRAKGTSNANSGHFILSVLLLSIQFIYWVSNHSL